jgi:hypothetical protein
MPPENYKTRAYDFMRLTELLEDWLAEPDDRCPNWYGYHGGCMHGTKDCIRAQDDTVKSKGQSLPSATKAQVARDDFLSTTSKSAPTSPQQTRSLSSVYISSGVVGCISVTSTFT